MTAAQYAAVIAVPFALPAHPGGAPVHGAAPTAFQIAETIRVFNADLEELAIASRVGREIKQQILLAVDTRYITALEHEDFGFADVTVAALLTHLTETYGQLTRAEIEANRSSIATAWTPEDPIEELWSRLREIKRISIVAGEELQNDTLMSLTFLMFEATGVFSTACDMWRVKPDADKTMPNFKTHFNTENEERIRKLTIAQAGFHGANAANETPETPPADDVAAAAVVSPAPAPPPAAAGNPHAIANDGVRMYYCWSHGLGTNSRHTSATCN